MAVMGLSLLKLNPLNHYYPPLPVLHCFLLTKPPTFKICYDAAAISQWLPVYRFPKQSRLVLTYKVDITSVVL